MKTSQLLRARWAAVGAALAVSIGAGGVWVTHAASSPSSVVLVEPARILDTRDGTDLGLAGPFTSPVPRNLQVTGDIPTATGNATVVPSGATGVLLNVTPVGAEADGFISVRPGDAAGAATTSSLNFTAGETNPTSVQVELPTSGPETGEIKISYDALGIAAPSTEILVDVVGYTVPGGVDPDLATEIEDLREDVTTLQSSQPFTEFSRRGFQTVNTTGQVVGSVTVEVPVDGSVTVVSAATVADKQEGEGIRCSISASQSFQLAWIQRWQSGGEGDGQDGQVSGVRTFLREPGTHTFSLVCIHDGPAGSEVSIDNIVLAAIFTP